MPIVPKSTTVQMAIASLFASAFISFCVAITAAAPHMLAPEPISTALSLLSPKALAVKSAKQKVAKTIKAAYITPMVPTLAISLRLMLKPKSMMPSLKICFPAIATTPLLFKI